LPYKQLVGPVLSHLVDSYNVFTLLNFGVLLENLRSKNPPRSTVTRWQGKRNSFSSTSITTIPGTRQRSNNHCLVGLIRKIICLTLKK